MSIKTNAEIIRDETTNSANTATRVGGLLVEITDNLISKDAEISNKQDKPLEGAFINGDKTKLDGVETGAQVNPDVSIYTEKGSYTGTSQDLKSLIDNLTSGYQGSLAIADTPTVDGYYLASESGAYTNASSVVVNLDNGVTFISKIGSNYDTSVIPLETILETNFNALISALVDYNIILDIGTELQSYYNLNTIQGYVKDDGTFNTNASFQRTDYIPLDSNMTSLKYRGDWNNSSIYMAFYNENQDFISNVSIGGSVITEKVNIPIPVNAKFVIASGATGTPIEILTEQYFSKLDVRITTLENAETDFSPLDSTEIIFPVGTDLVARVNFNYINGYINTDGTININTLFHHTDFIPVHGATQLTYIGNWTNFEAVTTAYYDTDKNLISTQIGVNGETTNITLNIPNNAVYIKSSSRKTDNIQLITTELLSYVPLELSLLKANIETRALKTSIFGAEPADFVDLKHDFYDKLPNFRDVFLNYSKDCNIVFQGTSMTEGTNYTTGFEDADTRPIHCHARNLPGLLWEDIKYSRQNQFHRRYDSGYITESGTWADKTTDATWDDPNKNPLSRASMSANASLSFVVPIDSWAFRFLYTAEENGDTCTVSITEGNGKLQVYNGTSWVEANGYTFSTVQSHAGQSDYDLGIGKVIYGKRLEFRSRNESGNFNTRNEAKTITITKSANTLNRLTYWGVEWSNSAYMLSIINAGRGSGSYRVQTGQLIQNVSPYHVETDIIEFNPTLLLVEISHNRFEFKPDNTIPVIAEWYFGEDENGNNISQPLSLAEKTNEFADCDVVFYTPPVRELLGVPQVYNGNLFTRQKNYTYAYNWLKTNKANFGAIDVLNAFVKAGTKFYGDYNIANQITSPDGESLFNDGVHPNKRGYKLWYKAIRDIFNL